MTEDQFDPLDEAFGEDGLIELIDEDGESQTFELLGAFDMDGEHYLAVSEPTDETDIESMEVFILKTIEDEDGNDIYVTPEDDEADAAFEFFLNMVDAAEADGEDGEDA